MPNWIFNVTNRCNFNCKHCFRDFSQPKDMPLDVVEKALIESKAYGLNFVTLTGGEPFLHSEFKRLIELIFNHGFKFSIVTNGWLTENFTDILERFRKNIIYIAFSLESNNARIHDSIRQAGSFEKVLSSIRLCWKLKIHPRVVMTVNKINFNDVWKMPNFVWKKGAKSICFTTVLPCPRSEKEQLVLNPEERKLLYNTLIKKRAFIPISYSADIKAWESLTLCRAFEMIDWTLDADGNIAFCCELIGYKSEKRKLSILSLKDHSLSDCLKAYAEEVHRAIFERIDAYQNEVDPYHIDFNSCFYCIKRL